MMQERRLNKVLGHLAVRLESVPRDALASLIRVERDADIDTIALGFYWTRPAEGSHPWAMACRDIVFSAQSVGTGVDLTVERFKRMDDEEKKRQAMGMSSWRKALELKALVVHLVQGRS